MLHFTSSPFLVLPALITGIAAVNLVTQEEFNNAVTKNGYPTPSASKYNYFVSNLAKGSISTKQEAGMALAQFLYESEGLTSKRERGCQVSGCPKYYRTPDCDAPGQFYYGRGYLQLSWCYNYKACSQDLYNSSSLLVKNPDLVASDEERAWATAFWYWKVYVHNAAGVAQGEFGATTNAINGDLECNEGPEEDRAVRRFEIYNVVRGAFGLSGDGDESGCYD